MDLTSLKNILRQKQKIFIFVAAILIIIGLIVVGKSFINPEVVNKQTDDDILFGGKPTAIFNLGQTAKLGSLEITIDDKKESSYTSLELDENYQRTKIDYLAIRVKVFNPSPTQTENLLIGLIDNQKSKYKPSFSIAHDIAELKDFSRNTSIFPRIIQEGYLFFTNINKESGKMQLIFVIRSTQEKIAFEFER